MSFPEVLSPEEFPRRDWQHGVLVYAQVMLVFYYLSHNLKLRLWHTAVTSLYFFLTVISSVPFISSMYRILCFFYRKNHQNPNTVLMAAVGCYFLCMQDLKLFSRPCTFVCLMYSNTYSYMGELILWHISKWVHGRWNILS